MTGTLARSTFSFLILAALGAAGAGGSARAEEAPQAAGGAVAGLVRQLETGSAFARAQAADAIAKLGPKARAAEPALVRALRRPPERIPGRGGSYSPSEAAARALWAVRQEAILRVLEGDDKQSSLNIVEALKGIGGAGVVPALKLAMLDHCDKVRTAATGAMGRVGAAKGVALPACAVRRLAKATEDSSADVRTEAVKALSGLSGDQGEAALIEAVRGATHRDVRLAAMEALAADQDARRKEALRRAAADKDGNVAATARKLLARGSLGGGVINAQTLASAKNLRPLSIIDVRTFHNRPGRKGRPSSPRRAGGGQDGHAAQKQANDGPSIAEMMALLRSGKEGAPDLSGGVSLADVERALSDPATMALAKKLAASHGSSSGTSKGPNGDSVDWAEVVRAAAQLATGSKPTSPKGHK